MTSIDSQMINLCYYRGKTTGRRSRLTCLLRDIEDISPHNKMIEHKSFNMSAEKLRCDLTKVF